jgi:hypothetical protein
LLQNANRFETKVSTFLTSLLLNARRLGLAAIGIAIACVYVSAATFGSAVYQKMKRGINGLA